MKTIKLEDLGRLFELVIEKLAIQESINKIDVDRDMYSFIPTDKWQSIGQKPLVGSLHDDIDSLSKVLTDPNVILTYADFDRIANVLHFISEKMNPVSGVPFEESGN